jgi:16S rRNA (guanine527-N7)-methyltransferase
MKASTRARIRELVERHSLSPAATDALGALLELLMVDRAAPTALRTENRILDDHLADSLVALELPLVRGAATIADLGSGAGLPGLPLAIARPDARVALVESSDRRCAFLRRAVGECALRNVEVVNARAEAWPEGSARFELVTARAVAALEVVEEYAAPLLRVGGSLVAWGGGRDREAERAAELAACRLGLSAPEPIHVRPYPSARERHLYVVLKVMDTPAGFPRRPGMARKRPLGSRG